MQKVNFFSSNFPQVQCQHISLLLYSSETATEMIKGLTLDEALKIKNSDVVEELEGLPPQKIHCSVLAEEAIAEAIKDYRSRH